MSFLPWVVLALAAIGIVVLMIPRRRPQESGPSSKETTISGVALANSQQNAGLEKSPDAKVALRDRLIHAGFYREGFLPLLQVLRIALLAFVVLGGYLLSLAGLVSLKQGLTIGFLGAGFAALMPGFLLDYLKGRRQTAMRRALPDALDVIVVSLGGGLPVAASFRRVASELSGIHPLLASEMTIVQREVQMGRSLGQAMHHLAMRFDLDDLRSMASVIQQSERYGASVTRAFQIFSDGLRASRIQKAEETARKASVKLIFPTVLFIFPVMFVVILAPAFIQLSTVLKSFNTQVTLP